MKKTFRKGGIHPNDNKLTANAAITPLPCPSTLNIILSQSIGAPSQATVKAGDTVVAGQEIAKAGGYVSASLHSPANGTVKKISSVRDVAGYPADAVEISVNQDNTNPEQDRQVALEPMSLEQYYAPADIVARVSACGIVGLGGATFPTAVKLSPGKEYRPEFVIINGAECEPWLTCDDRLMREHPDEVVRGARWLMKAVKVHTCYIGIEENKPEAIDAMRDAATHHKGVQIVELKKKYPQGGEKQLIDAILGKQVPPGALPVYVGAIVDNVATAYAVYQACEKGLPLTSRVVTVTGPSLKNPGNFLVQLGTPVRDLIEAAGGLPEDTGKVISGGPMMGRALASLDTPTTKGMSGILVLPESESRRLEPEACIRCASCVEVCPMGLEPYLLAAQSVQNMWEDTKEHNVADCIECGSCVYTCPASRPLLDFIRLAKRQIRKLK
ncbi:MAG: electron transport complex subunit RsxC [Prevotella sp.]|nr:electron transport complex subunit RsxC [Prevotella sp.]MCM1074105.1 electron transport complex subunit RsxC [Ruminococcus sp.]